MKWIFTIVFALLIVLTYSFTLMRPKGALQVEQVANDPVSPAPEPAPRPVHVQKQKQQDGPVNVDPMQFVAFAKNFIGVPYVYGSVDPRVGFDCSGFINHVAHHFNMDVPRSSVDFAHFGLTVALNEAKAGDLILFTGTDASRRIVGHMGIITETNGDSLQFIHSTSGKAKGVTVSDLSKHYRERFVKVVRIL
jgi:cell wall-associated NlpC family hydrolase